MSITPVPSLLATTPKHYRALNLSPTAIESWEDGLRTSPSKAGEWEWWYFDAHLDNGAKLVVVFFTKDFSTPNTGLNPQIWVQLDTPNGRSWDIRQPFEPGAFSASTEGCDVRIAGAEGEEINFFRGENLRNYDIRARVKGLDVTVNLASETVPWRPATGYAVYGETEEQYFAWLPSVPYGQVKATYHVQGEDLVTAGGHGYHDHNWGNVPLADVVNYWYWGRGSVGPYKFISSSIYNAKKYGDKEILIFMLQRDGVVVADDGSKAVFTSKDVNVDGPTRRPVADTVEFKYTDGDTEYRLEYVREKTILRTYHVDSLKGMLWALAKLVGYDGCYLRFTGTVKFQKYTAGQLEEEYKDEVLWELMWFGQDRNEILKQ